MDEEDAREVELSSITAIYSEELKVDDNNPYHFTIELPLSLSKPLTVKFPAASEAVPPIPYGDAPVDPRTCRADSQVDSQELSNLPSLLIGISLPNGYPHHRSPSVKISTHPPWLPTNVISRLEARAHQLWEDIGRDQVVFTYIDEVQQSADDVFGMVYEDNTLQVEPKHKIAILDYDIKAKKEAFQKRTFDCGICLDPKKGLVCHRMHECGHVFCIRCLQDFYKNAISEGDVTSVQCLEPGCANKREKAAAKAATGRSSRKFKTFISPGELLQIPLDYEVVERYVALKHKSELESDKNTVYCPRPWCQGAARSRKHKKPEGLEFAEDSEDESDVDQANDVGENAREEKVQANSDLLAICEDCSFAFCSRCGQSWHGEFKYCVPKERRDEITEEEKASLDYLSMYTTPCPTCAAPCQKTHGCNHMRCFRCQTHFCYLCSAWLNPENPYQHFNTVPKEGYNSCYMRLWELEEGDGNDVGHAYRGGEPQAPRNVEVRPAAPAVHQRRDEAAPVNNGHGPDDIVEINGPDNQLQVPAEDQPANGRVAVAREGPLVLRIGGDAPAARGGQQPQQQRQQPPPAAAAAPPANGVQRGRGRRARGGARPGFRAAPAARHQNNHNNHNLNHRAPAQAQIQNPNGRLVGREPGIRPNVEPGQGLNVADEFWVRQFVQLALNDEEHLLEGNSSDEDDDWEP